MRKFSREVGISKAILHETIPNTEYELLLGELPTGNLTVITQDDDGVVTESVFTELEEALINYMHYSNSPEKYF